MPFASVDAPRTLEELCCRDQEVYDIFLYSVAVGRRLKLEVEEVSDKSPKWRFGGPATNRTVKCVRIVG
jgi:hypothetical protein